ncbi:MAG: hypothetical protein HY094_01975 [Candidatus Melainabacteria bacterium]|nr:hypothetical protein [Candidatus Melainabacteria bacterium]
MYNFKIKSKKIFPYLLLCLHTISIVSLVCLYNNYNYEERLCNAIVSQVISEGMTQKQKALALLHIAHKLLQPRAEILGNIDPSQELFDNRLLEAGSCGDFTNVLARLLQKVGFKVRIAQMLHKEQKQNRTEQNRTEQNRTEQNRTEQNRTD